MVTQERGHEKKEGSPDREGEHLESKKEQRSQQGH
jgi:hypothetical protein